MESEHAATENWAMMGVNLYIHAAGNPKKALVAPINIVAVTRRFMTAAAVKNAKSIIAKLILVVNQDVQNAKKLRLKMKDVVSKGSTFGGVNKNKIAFFFL